MRVLRVNAVFHDPAAALVIDVETVAAAEEERVTDRHRRRRARGASLARAGRGPDRDGRLGARGPRPAGGDRLLREHVRRCGLHARPRGRDRRQGGGRPLLVALRALGVGDPLTGMPAPRALAEAFPGHRRAPGTPSVVLFGPVPRTCPAIASCGRAAPATRTGGRSTRGCSRSDVADVVGVLASLPVAS